MNMQPDRILFFLLILIPMMHHIQVQAACASPKGKCLREGGTCIGEYETCSGRSYTKGCSKKRGCKCCVGCGGEYNSSNGTIRHPWSGDRYGNEEDCSWKIKVPIGIINITFARIETEQCCDDLFLRDGDSLESNLIDTYYGSYDPMSVLTTGNAAHLNFKSDQYTNAAGFELYWEAADAPIQTFYSVHLNSDYEVRLNFSANPQELTALEWSYGANFQEMPNLINIPSDNGKFSTSLIDDKNGNYQAVLKIAGITEEDYETKFKLHVANSIAETNYRVILSALLKPPSNLEVNLISKISVEITWDYSINPGDIISYYVIQYKPTYSDQEYEEISDISTKSFTFNDLMESTEYEFQVLAVNNFGRGPPSVASYVTTGCGGEYNAVSGTIRHPNVGGKYKPNDNCTWIIRAPVGAINMTFISFETDGRDYLSVRDGESIDSDELDNLKGTWYPVSLKTFTNAAHLNFIANDDESTGSGFEMSWQLEDRKIQTYNVRMHSDYEVRLNFYSNPQPNVLEWYYGPNFEEMPNLIQIPSDNGKYSTSLIELENGNYQALLKITEITGEDIETKFKLHVANSIGEADYRIELYGCGGEYSSSSGMIRHPFTGDKYQNNENCTWIIRAEDRIKIRFVKFDTSFEHDNLTIINGENDEPNMLYTFSGTEFSGSNVPASVKTDTNIAQVIFNSGQWPWGTGFELHWEPNVITYYQVLLHSDYEIKPNFTSISQPTAVKWYYGANFQDMPNIIQIPSDNGKFRTSLKDFEYGSYQALLRIAGVTEEDLQTKFKLNVASEFGEINYRYTFSAFPSPPEIFKIDGNVTSFSAKFAWDYLFPPGNISHYVLQYKINTASNQDYTDISDIVTKSYTVRGLKASTEYIFQVLAVNKFGRGTPSEPIHITTASCGGEYSSSYGTLRHPVIEGTKPEEKESCVWIIRAPDHTIEISFVRFEVGSWNYLYIRNGDNFNSGLLEKYYGNTIPNNVQTTKNAAHLHFTGKDRIGFELQWKPLVKTFYQVSMHRDYEIRMDFKFNPRPTALDWSYGANFQEMSNLIQIPSDNGKFSTSIIDSGRGWYQARLQITGITKEDIATKFKLHVEYKTESVDYRVALSELPHAPVNFKKSIVMPTSVRLTWNYNDNPTNISHYVMQYKLRSCCHNYTEISGITTTYYTVRGLTPETEYTFRVLAVNEFGQGPPSKHESTTTKNCGGEFFTNSGRIRHPSNGSIYGQYEDCTWVIWATDSAINITFTSIDILEKADHLTIRDGESPESKILGWFSGNYAPSVVTSKNVANMVFKSGYKNEIHKGFDLHWKPADSDAVTHNFYQIPKNSDYEVRLNFYANPQPTALKWSYLAHFQDMPNIIQIPSDNGKYVASLIDLEKGNYLALLRIAGITEEDIDTQYKLHVTNEIDEFDYRVALSAFPSPPTLDITEILPTMVRITWKNVINIEDIVYQGILYKPRNTNQDYTEISGLYSTTQSYLFKGLSPSTEYKFRTFAEYKTGRGPPSEPLYVTTTNCGGEYNSINGTIRHERSDDYYQGQDNCIWIIRVPIGAVDITFDSYSMTAREKLIIRDGDSIDSKVIKEYSRWDEPKTILASGSAVHLLFRVDPNEDGSRSYFEFHWGYGDAAIQTFNVPINSDYEVRFDFSRNPPATSIEWYYGANFEEMPNVIPNNSDGEKFSTYLTDLENGNIQAVLRIAGVTEEDLKTMFKLRVVNEIGKVDYRAMLYGCGGEYNSNNGTIRHPFYGDGDYKNNMNCTWIIRAADRINISFISFRLDAGSNEGNRDYLYIRDGDSIKSKVVTRFTGSSVPWPVQTSTHAAHLLFISVGSKYSTDPGFEIQWEPFVPACSGLFTPVGDSCLLLSMAEKLTWAAAREYCQALGADLVVIKDANHYADILRYIWRINGDNTAIDLWIGGSDEAMEGHWIWITGERMRQGPPYWGSLDRFVAEPSGGNIENCAGLYHLDRYYIHDFACSQKHAPVCQKIPT